MENAENKGKNSHVWWKIAAILLLLSFLLNALARNSTSFCDFYVTRIFPLWVETYGRFSGLFSFSMGEIGLYLGVILVIGWGICLLAHGVWVLCHVTGRAKASGKRKARTGKAEGVDQPYGESQKWPAFLIKYEKIVAFTVAVVFLIMTLNCYILYHATPFSSRYDMTGSGRDYSVEELGILRDYVVNRANDLAEEMPRDDRGRIVTDLDLKEQARKEMGRLGETYPMLSGYYPKPKGLWLSWFYSQQYIMGYYFPFSMEANYNRDMYITNTPVTMCHELSHLKGNIYEDEANFIGYLACVDSEEALFQYSAYLSVIGYLNRDFKAAAGPDSEEYKSHPVISQKVREDRIFLTEEAWEKVEETSVLDTETVREATTTFLETNLTTNGVSQGIVSYSEVVERLLEYYEGILY